MEFNLVAIVGYYVERGGFIMPPLFVGALLMWYGIGYRFANLRRGDPRSGRELVDVASSGEALPKRGVVDAAVTHGIELATTSRKLLRERLDEAFIDYEENLRTCAMLVHVIVIVAPLLGLLGTVSGMVETFSSLGDMSIFAQSGGVAGGISQALFSTQLGLAVAVPGMLVGRVLDRRQNLIERELVQIKDLICVRYAAEES